jgi:hypothetical protein
LFVDIHNIYRNEQTNECKEQTNEQTNKQTTKTKGVLNARGVLKKAKNTHFKLVNFLNVFGNSIINFLLSILFSKKLDIIK